MTNGVKFIGLDVHKRTISIAIANAGRDSEVRYYGTIEKMLDSLSKFIRILGYKTASYTLFPRLAPVGMPFTAT